jgi:transposase
MYRGDGGVRQCSLLGSQDGSLGHEPKLIAPRYVKPFIKRQKNDAADAEGTVEAAQRPTMRFVAAKTEEQQSRAIVFRTREQMVNQRTELVNALRAHLYEFGHVAPQGIGHLSRLEEVVEDEHADLPELVRDTCRDLLDQIWQLTSRIDALKKRIDALSRQAETSRRLQTMPGVGAIAALAIETFAPPMPVCISHISPKTPICVAESNWRKNVPRAVHEG